MKSPQPGQEYLDYRAVLAEAATQDPREWTFKSNPVYQAILEHVSPEQGEAYLLLVRQEFQQQWEEEIRWSLRPVVLSNDSLGKPTTFFSPQSGLTCSPTNFRYLYHAVRVLSHAKQSGAQKHFVEVGAGYGGLALYVLELASLFGVDVQSYTMIDVPEASAVQAAFCRDLLGNPPLFTADGTDSDAIAQVVDKTGSPPGSRFLISAYAFSEFSDPVQTWYQDLLVRHCDHGFLVWNLRRFFRFTNKPCFIEDERPLTGMGNLYVSF